MKGIWGREMRIEGKVREKRENVMLSPVSEETPTGYVIAKNQRE